MMKNFWRKKFFKRLLIGIFIFIICIVGLGLIVGLVYQQKAENLLKTYEKYKIGDTVEIKGYDITLYSAKVENNGYTATCIFKYSRDDGNIWKLIDVNEFEFAKTVAPVTGGGSGGYSVDVYRTWNAVYLKFYYKFDSFYAENIDKVISFMEPGSGKVLGEYNISEMKWQNLIE